MSKAEGMLLLVLVLYSLVSTVIIIVLLRRYNQSTKEYIDIINFLNRERLNLIKKHKKHVTIEDEEKLFNFVEQRRIEK